MPGVSHGPEVHPSPTSVRMPEDPPNDGVPFAGWFLASVPTTRICSARRGTSDVLAKVRVSPCRIVAFPGLNRLWSMEMASGSVGRAGERTQPAGTSAPSSTTTGRRRIGRPPLSDQRGLDVGDGRRRHRRLPRPPAEEAVCSEAGRAEEDLRGNVSSDGREAAKGGDSTPRWSTAWSTRGRHSGSKGSAVPSAVPIGSLQEVVGFRSDRKWPALRRARPSRRSLRSLP